MTESLLMSVREAASALGVGRDAAYALVHEGRIRTVRVGRKILVPRIELEHFVEREASREETA